MAPRDQPARKEPRLHPLSAVAILVLDWLFFGGNALTALALSPLWIVAGAGVAAATVYWLQTRRSHDPPRAALLKALVAAVLVGVPFPIAGTFAGAGVLAAAGLKRLQLGRGRTTR